MAGQTHPIDFHTYEAYEIANFTAEYCSLLRFALPENVSFPGTANPSPVLMLAERRPVLS